MKKECLFRKLLKRSARLTETAKDSKGDYSMRIIKICTCSVCSPKQEGEIINE